ncbi:helix-turn-helix domain-containing protein [Aquimarina sp. 2201CG5-10]|uniref:helix-turn-helix domain-containing protein n=1 Tax=Aquimarina callyspongiae TaxID=3098150 RepID=UPI002AB3ABDC|nr:helix-turn-helix domain-containing protein [Aquimarina sp. 2201CG5-10]MDY8138847.1 helix-turn-helix domain-containing protein [Aquimarina sp. 2201CG5-10]
MKTIYAIVILWVGITNLYSKEVHVQKGEEINTIKSDSLKEKNFKELNYLFWKHKKDSIVRQKIAIMYLVKARDLRDSILIANGYQMFYTINRRKREIALKYSDSMIQITKGIKDQYYPAAGYLLKGSVLFGMERYNEALESYLISKKHAEINNNEKHIIALKHNIALLKTALGRNKEALKVYKENFEYLLKKDTVSKFHSTYIATLYKLSDTYNRLKHYDSANYYLKRGIKTSLSGKNRYYYPDLLSAYGVNSYYREKYQPAVDSLQKTLKLLKYDPDDTNVRISYLYLAKAFFKLDKEELGLEYLKKVDAATNESNYIIETQEAFTLLIDYYKKREDQVNQLEVMEKLIHYKSVSDKKYKKLNNTIIKEYDIAKLIEDKDRLINKIANKNKKSTYKIVAIGVSVMIVIGLLYFLYYKKQKNKYEKAFHKQLQQAEISNKKRSKNSSTGIELAPELKKEILKKIEEFENNHEYLKNDLTLTKVSKKMKTNSTYLSKTINKEKQKNFANYINDLRIEYCVHQIENDKKFRRYSIKSMAKEVGFNNIQSFAKAFLKQKGCNPAEYVKNFDNQ